MEPRLNDEDRAVRERAAAAAAELVLPRAEEIDTRSADPRELISELGRDGVLRSPMEAPGGAVRLALLIEELGAASGSVGALAAAHLGEVGMVVRRHGEAGDRNGLVEELGAGRTLGASLRRPDLRARGDDRFRIVFDRQSATVSGGATAVTGAALADVLLVFADDEGGDGPTAVFLVPADRRGIRIEEEAERLGLNGAGIADVQLEEVAVGEGDRLAPEAGDAAATAASLAGIGRASLAVGLGRAALEASLELVEGDEEAGGSQSVQWKLADSATETEAARLLTWYAATQEEPQRGETAAMARFLAAEAAVASSRRAVQIHGISGTVRGRTVERIYRDAELLEVHAGSSDAQLEIVARHLLPDLAAS